MKVLNKKNIPIEKRPVKVLQFGEGNFLRAFVDWMIDVLNEKTDFNGSVYVIQPIKQGMVDVLNAQDGLYHVWLNGIKGGEEVNLKKLIKSIAGAMDPHKDYQRFLKLAELEELQFVVSNTTEAGIVFDKSDSTIEKLPNGFPGKLTALLFHRYQHFSASSDKGLFIIPCELINKNGDALKENVLHYAKHFGLPDAFSDWVKKHNTFCNTLVDRIVPGFPKENINDIREELGFEDNLVVQAEPFHLLVIEAPEAVQKALPVHKADLDVKFVKDLSPYRTRKVRILNGAHTAMVPVAYLKGIRTVGDTIADKEMHAYVYEIIFNEIVPTLDLPKEELTQFANDVIERFKNPFIRHELISIALNSVSKYKVRVLPSVLEYKQRFDTLPEHLLHALAALIVFYRGRYNGERIALNDADEVLSFFEEAWKTGDIERIVTSALSRSDFWGMDLTTIENLPALVQEHVAHILEEEQIKTF